MIWLNDMADCSGAASDDTGDVAPVSERPTWVQGGEVATFIQAMNEPRMLRPVVRVVQKGRRLLLFPFDFFRALSRQSRTRRKCHVCFPHFLRFLLHKAQAPIRETNTLTSIVFKPSATRFVSSTQISRQRQISKIVEQGTTVNMK